MNAPCLRCLHILHDQAPGDWCLAAGVTCCAHLRATGGGLETCPDFDPRGNAGLYDNEHLAEAVLHPHHYEIYTGEAGAAVRGMIERALEACGRKV